MNRKILVIDDEKLIRWTLEQHLVKEGYDVVTAESAEKGFELAAEEAPDLILLDNRLPEMSGLELLEKLEASKNGFIVIMVTAYGLIETAVKAMKLGAYDYISKPFNLDEISLIVKKAIETGALRNQVRRLRQQFQGTIDSLVGDSGEMVKVKNLIGKVAESDATTVLIQGESGTGKEIVAKALHYTSARADKPFMAVNCAAVPMNLLESELMGHEKGAFTDAKAVKKGLFELGDGGSVFLDEIGDMPLNMQAKLLRLLEERCFKRVGGVRDIKVDVRIISATNQELSKAMNEGRFRKDLYYRLQVVPICLPPLRERGEDILRLTRHFIEHFNRECHKDVQTISKEAEQILVSYAWPGNVRQLKNVVERAMILDIESEMLPEHLSQDVLHGTVLNVEPGKRISLDGFVIPESGISLEEMENALIRRALEMSGGNHRRAAQLLKMNLDLFKRRMKRFGIA